MKFEVWASIMTLTLSVWPKYFSLHPYSIETNNWWKLVAMHHAISQEPRSKVLSTNIVKKKRTKLYKTKFFFVLKKREKSAQNAWKWINKWENFFFFFLGGHHLRQDLVIFTTRPEMINTGFSYIEIDFQDYAITVHI